jgi:hypothetical protein
MRALFDDIVRAIKQHLPNARTSWDISPWIGEAGKSFFASIIHDIFEHCFIQSDEKMVELFCFCSY